MIGLYKFGVLIACIVLLAPLATGQNLTRYREFEFGMSVASVAQQTQSAPKTVHTTPNLIQTIQWNRQNFFSSSSESDPVRSIRFDFYDNQLFKIVATYENRQLEGMTADDLIEVISKIYGPSLRTDETVNVAAFTGYEDRQKVLARWENSENTYSLFRSSYGGEFGLVADSKKFALLVSGSIREAERLEVLAAPQRAIDRQQKEATDRRAAEEKARSVNKPNFRP